MSVDGADWSGSWHASVLAPALAQLGIPPRDWPVSVFTPLIIDNTGGKLSKTLYVARGTYADLPEAFLNLDILLARHGAQVLDAIWVEVTRWAAEPRRLQLRLQREALAKQLILLDGEIRGMFTALCANALCCAASNILVRTETRFTTLQAEQANEVAARPDDGESPTACPTHFELLSAKFVVEVDGSAGESPEWRGR